MWIPITLAVAALRLQRQSGDQFLIAWGPGVIAGPYFAPFKDGEP